MATVASPMTTAELLALPENGTDRWLIAGELRERPMTIRDRFHSRVMIRVGRALDEWLDNQPEPKGQVLGGEAGVILKHDPDSTVGVDMLYIGPEVMTRQSENSTIIDGAPVVAVEILSPSDTVEDIHEKIGQYLHAGVPLVWIVDPYDRTVRVYRHGAEPEHFNVRQELSAEPHLPGFKVAVAWLFD